MDDLNWGFLAKMFMDKLASKRTEPEEKKRKPKKKPLLTQKNHATNSSSFLNTTGVDRPCHLHQDQWAAFSQFEALRMQLLRQLVIYQKQLLALKMPMMLLPNPRLGQSSNEERSGKPTKASPIVRKTMSQFAANGQCLRTAKCCPSHVRSQPLVNSLKRKSTKSKKKTRKSKKSTKSKFVEGQNEQSDSQTFTQQFAKTNSKECCDKATFVIDGFYPAKTLDIGTRNCSLMMGEKENSTMEKLRGFNTLCALQETENIKPKGKPIRKALRNRNNTKAGGYKISSSERISSTAAASVFPSQQHHIL